MNAITPSPTIAALRPIETWRQDPSDPDLWHHASGLIVNGDALDERETFYSVVRVGSGDALYGQERRYPNLSA